MPKKITLPTTVAEILEHPHGEEILAKYGLPCLDCPLAAREAGALEIGVVCGMYGIDARELVAELNKKTEDKK